MNQQSEALTTDAYQKAAARTLIDGPDRGYTLQELNLIMAALNVSIKACEFSERIKKMVFHQHGVNYNILADLVAETDSAVAEVEAAILSMKGNADVQYTARRHLLLSALQHNPQAIMMLWNLTGILGEGHEVGEHIYNYAFGAELDRNEVAEELADLSWYIGAEYTKMGMQWSDWLLHNIAKLERAYPSGYTAAASLEKANGVKE